MELKTQGLDRLMEALSPAFAAELERAAQETRETLERDFQNRLQAAVQEAEAATKNVAQAELKRTAEEAAEQLKREKDAAAAEMKRAQDEAEARLNKAVSEAVAEATAAASAATRKEVTEELEPQFQQRLAETTTQLQASAAEERGRLEQQMALWQTFADAQRQFGESSSQAEMLSRFLRLSQPFAAGLAIYTAKADGLALWKSRGNTAFPQIISKETTDPDSYFRTISIRGKMVVGICARQPFKTEVLEFLSSSLERAIEVFGLKLQSPAPKLSIAQSAGSTTSAPAVAPASGNADDQKAHAEARRTARLLVSEIKLYHEQELASGRQNSDIYDRLRKEIDLGRQTYMNRVSSGVQASHDYFHEEVVRILGENNAARLGPAYPGPIHA